MDFQVAMQGETLRKGPWHEKEDERLITYVALLGERNWDALARAAGLKRSGKSCRLRWLNYLHPNLKRSRITEEEERIIIQLHQQWGNKWSRIARSLPGRTDNEIKNYWRSHLSKKIQAQEHANFQCTINNAKQELHYQNVDSKAWESTVEHNTIGFCSDHHALSDFSYLNSPYEARLLDWMSELPSDRSETKSNTDYNGVDSSLCYPDSNAEGSHVRISDSFVSLWDMN